ncbi:hypothetical protein GCWU000325_01526 [Alloprevotella tannerae ATCC 51259]|uniref:Uncharacterized protein n=1 Tax=Alloprevotella tannerae ATCC 51259 TaxID=626522 RepID=C9LH25_9BACT|nr:hypothetical protein GCWU000325_01526 [Alloprevotella tannerae ATCC 51259]
MTAYVEACILRANEPVLMAYAEDLMSFCLRLKYNGRSVGGLCFLSR